MGRELKRVPLDFDWPLDQIWKGYLAPVEQEASDDWENVEPPTGEGYQASAPDTICLYLLQTQK